MPKKRVAGYHQWRREFIYVFCMLGLSIILIELNSFMNWPHLPTGTTTMQDQADAVAPAQRKLAFLFVTRNRMPLDIVWSLFFQEAAKEFFSIYIHSRPGFIYNKRTTACRYFYNRQISTSILVDWGEASMIEAEKLLLVEALKDPANDRFVLVSDSCIPLYNFTYIYNYLMTSPKSFVDSFFDAKESRYNPKMAPVIQRENWRKGSQWFALKRDHAAIVAADADVFRMFQRHCKRRPLPEFWRQQSMNGDPSKQHNCIPDEHYVQTLLAIKGLEDEVERRGITFSLWDQSGRIQERKGWHPVTFALSDANVDLIRGIKNITSINYEAEYRTEWCTSNGTAQPCFLFARKFTRHAAMKLLNLTLQAI
ncbi:hypothetical protein KP509_23G005800 [Ceratopteris richardii]|uniref:Core-2/I-branching beta-1,6-N-acetylglucosaminyltransferase family protein n=1 Tax=Ceratopteris richardii TaxID=49495 RepID=A0A8T2RX75_CERRI|nr:hypothetical protein KP509_23G005800 [Ceratopteris richardii]